MRRRRGVFAFSSLLILSLIALVIGGAVLLPHFSFRAMDLQVARQRWATRAFSRYRLIVEYGEQGYCQQSVDVENERVVAVLANTCKRPTPTVTDLFERIERDTLALSGRCGINGCDCDGTLVVSAEYDPRYGYPRFKHVGLNSETRMLFPTYWQRRVSGGFCSQRQAGFDNLKVVELLPLG